MVRYILYITTSFLTTISLISCGFEEKTISDEKEVHEIRYPNGNIEALIQVDSTDEQDGVTLLLYPNGTPKELNSFVNGVLWGEHVMYFPHGIIQEFGQYKKGMMVGEWIEYFENGHVQQIIRFENDIKQGQFLSFHPNGFLAIKGQHVNDKEEGEWHYFGTEGNKLSTSVYRNGELLSEQIFEEYETIDDQ